MAINVSKINDPRFWKTWRGAGAVGSYDSAMDRLVATYRSEHGEGAAVVCRVGGRLVLDDPTAVAVVVLLNVDDVHGGPIADMLMPGHNWQEIRDRGEVPFARGLAMRSGIQNL